MKIFDLKKGIGLIIAAMMVACCMVPATVLAADGMKAVEEDKEFYKLADEGDLAADGYTWDADSSTLTLDNVNFKGSVFLPSNKEVKVIVKGDSIMDFLDLSNYKGSSSSTKTPGVEFTAENGAKLTINKGVNNTSDYRFIVDKSAEIDVLDGGVSLYSSSSADINGTLKIKVDRPYGSGLYAGDITVGSTGVLDVKALTAVKSNGTFRIVKGGRVHCNSVGNVEEGQPNFSLMVMMRNNDAGSMTDAEKLAHIDIPENYMPEGFKKMILSDYYNTAVAIVPEDADPLFEAESMEKAGCDLLLQYYAPAVPETDPEEGDVVIPEDSGDAAPADPEAQEEMTGSPQTDDPSSVLPLVGLLVAAGLGIVVIVVHAIRSANRDN